MTETYYELSIQPHDSAGPFGIITNKIQNENGEALWTHQVGVGQHEIRLGVDVRTAGDAYLVVPNAKRRGDLLSYSFRQAIIVRGSVMSDFLENQIRLDDMIYCWPLWLLERPGGPTVDKYQILWPLLQRDVLDVSNSSVDYYPGTRVIKKVQKWSLRPNAVAGIDLVPTAYNAWICSSRLVTRVTANGFTGFSFKKIGIVEV